MDNNNTDLNSTEDRPMSSEQTTRTTNNQTMSERAEKSKYKIPILSDRETDLTKANPKMWWEQILEYILLTYNRNLDEITDEGVEYMIPHTVYHIKGDVIWALGPKAKHEIMRGQWGREKKRCQIARITDTIQKNISPGKKRLPQQGPIFQYEAR